VYDVEWSAMRGLSSVRVVATRWIRSSSPNLRNIEQPSPSQSAGGNVTTRSRTAGIMNRDCSPI